MKTSKVQKQQQQQQQQQVKEVKEAGPVSDVLERQQAPPMTPPRPSAVSIHDAALRLHGVHHTVRRLRSLQGEAKNKKKRERATDEDKKTKTSNSSGSSSGNAALRHHHPGEHLGLKAAGLAVMGAVSVAKGAGRRLRETVSLARVAFALAEAALHLTSSRHRSVVAWDSHDLCLKAASDTRRPYKVLKQLKAAEDELRAARQIERVAAAQMSVNSAARLHQARELQHFHAMCRFHDILTGDNDDSDDEDKADPNGGSGSARFTLPASLPPPPPPPPRSSSSRSPSRAAGGGAGGRAAAGSSHSRSRSRAGGGRSSGASLRPPPTAPQMERAVRMAMVGVLGALGSQAEAMRSMLMASVAGYRDCLIADVARTVAASEAADKEADRAARAALERNTAKKMAAERKRKEAAKKRRDSMAGGDDVAAATTPPREGGTPAGSNESSPSSVRSGGGRDGGGGGEDAGQRQSEAIAAARAKARKRRVTLQRKSQVAVPTLTGTNEITLTRKRWLDQELKRLRGQLNHVNHEFSLLESCSEQRSQEMVCTALYGMQAALIAAATESVARGEKEAAAAAAAAEERKASLRRGSVQDKAMKDMQRNMKEQMKELTQEEQDELLLKELEANAAVAAASKAERDREAPLSAEALVVSAEGAALAGGGGGGGGGAGGSSSSTHGLPLDQDFELAATLVWASDGGRLAVAQWARPALRELTGALVEAEAKLAEARNRAESLRATGRRRAMRRAEEALRESKVSGNPDEWAMLERAVEECNKQVRLDSATALGALRDCLAAEGPWVDRNLRAAERGLELSEGALGRVKADLAAFERRTGIRLVDRGDDGDDDDDGGDDADDADDDNEEDEGEDEGEDEEKKGKASKGKESSRRRRRRRRRRRDKGGPEGEMLLAAVTAAEEDAEACRHQVKRWAKRRKMAEDIEGDMTQAEEMHASFAKAFEEHAGAVAGEEERR
eukprot:g6573.t1